MGKINNCETVCIDVHSGRLDISSFQTFQGVFGDVLALFLHVFKEIHRKFHENRFWSSKSIFYGEENEDFFKKNEDSFKKNENHFKKNEHKKCLFSNKSMS